MAGCVALQGVDKDFDDAEEAVKGREAALAEYLQQIRDELSAGQDLCYVTINKDVNLLEIPQVTFNTPYILTFTAYDQDLQCLHDTVLLCYGIARGNCSATAASLPA